MPLYLCKYNKLFHECRVPDDPPCNCNYSCSYDDWLAICEFLDFASLWDYLEYAEQNNQNVGGYEEYVRVYLQRSLEIAVKYAAESSLCPTERAVVSRDCLRNAPEDIEVEERAKQNNGAEEHSHQHRYI